MSYDGILELFAGPGGWSTGLRMAGYTGRAIGVECDLAACRTAAAAGHERIRADVTTYPPERFTGAEGLILSPPCQAWSRAGKGLGLKDQPAIRRHTHRVATAGRWVDYPRAGWHDDRSPLVLEVLRWVLAVRPRWFAGEQVPAVLPYWRELAGVLRGHGYHTAAYEARTEEYGVPQTRIRAILVGHLDIAVSAPAPTHQRYVPGEPARRGEHDLFGGAALRPWVSMGDALGYPADVAVRSNYGTGGDANRRGIRRADEPAAAVTFKVGRNVVFRNGPQSHATERDGTEPAPTIYCSRPGNLTWVYRNGNQAHSARRAPTEPAPTVLFGARSNKVEWMPVELASDPAASGIRVTLQEAGILQGFPADYPWRGTKSEQGQQVGDAVPPPLAAAILRPLITAGVSERAA
ncbi:MAG: DNA cytosine methyltransferase [Actinobacteria bacterium]|nr:DNA cytosine methyltransferase [Actinomycetota bacterium]